MFKKFYGIFAISLLCLSLAGCGHCRHHKDGEHKSCGQCEQCQKHEGCEHCGKHGGGEGKSCEKPKP